jgi:hypothetical protein
MNYLVLGYEKHDNIIGRTRKSKEKKKEKKNNNKKKRYKHYLIKYICRKTNIMLP